MGEELIKAGCRRRGARTFQEAAGDVLDESEAAQQGRGIGRPMRTGINTLDDIWGGLWPGLGAPSAWSTVNATVLLIQPVARPAHAVGVSAALFASYFF